MTEIRQRKYRLTEKSNGDMMKKPQWMGINIWSAKILVPSTNHLATRIGKNLHFWNCFEIWNHCIWSVIDRKQTGRWMARMILTEPEPLFATTIILSTTRVRTNVSRTQWQILSACRLINHLGRKGSCRRQLHQWASSQRSTCPIWCHTGTRHQQSAILSRKNATRHMATEQNHHEAKQQMYAVFVQRGFMREWHTGPVKYNGRCIHPYPPPPSA